MSPEVKLEKIVKTKYESIDKIWRKTPGCKEDCKIFLQMRLLEEYDSSKIEPGMLPLISKKVFEQKYFEQAKQIFYELYGSEIKDAKKRSYESTYVQGN